MRDSFYRVSQCAARNAHTDQLDWFLPAHRRGILGGIGAAQELPWMASRRVSRWRAGKGPAARPGQLLCN
ncbi:hypothetical protein DGM85_14910 [Xanthomonas phaseoli pv. phaseoli]|nr:hypothetical protein DGM93_14690 [Xanthomonas phaseoli pv. phaseoli]QWN29598.1 hypothetical protein DGM85_14910 [Xanthomonas phaseoli pv. phaseoli]QWN33704.1 hypothetical protein DGM81_14445 [Xanthomonas phaseoli pv. phaseoli]